MDQNSKQQVVESLKKAVNVLVTVSANPSVDQLSAALGFTLMLGKLDKHATAVFSGVVPEVMKFLDPKKTFESNTDSLRDFIVALDKSKADKLRYKVEDNVVKIFITPYRTKISKDDFQFTQGDFNVDAVVALGVKKREDLDNAIKAHGRILHDASVLTINAGGETASLGSIDWNDPAAGSLCEMMVSISESFGGGLLDQQISTAYLTGIVAATERFSNDRTTPKVMTMSAQLMAAGANQQLIASELNISPKSKDLKPLPARETRGRGREDELRVEHDEKPRLPELRSAARPTEQLEDGQPNQHFVPPSSEEPTTPNMQTQPASATPPPLMPLPPPPVPQDDASDSANLPPVQAAQAVQPQKSLEQFEDEISSLSALGSRGEHPKIKQDKHSNGPILDSYSQDHGVITGVKGQGPRDTVGESPILGGTFNATSEAAHEEAEREKNSQLNNSILDHTSEAGKSSEQESNELSIPEPTKPTPVIPPMTPPVNEPAESSHQEATILPPVSTYEESSGKPNGVLDADAARNAVDNVFDNQPFNPGNNPEQRTGSKELGTAEESSEPQEIQIDSSGKISSAQ